MEKFVMSEFLVFMVLFLLCDFVMCQECTNTPTSISSHTVRAKVLASNNNTLKEQMFAHYHHLTPTDDSTWSNLFPRKMLKEVDEFNWAKMYRNVKNSLHSSSGDFLKEVSLHDVRLDPSSIQWQAQQTNLKYLLMLDVDRLVWSFRKTAGLPTPGNPYGGWEEPKMELRGHFVGHYLSASAQMWASTHNDDLKEKMSALVSALSECQQKIGTGYLSAFPTKFFDRFEAIKPIWAPYYTIHKILAGLLDQYTFAGNAQALKIMTWMVDYFYKRVQNVITKYSVQRHYLSLNEETGGMNDVLYRLYAVTGDSKHLMLAHLFDKPCFLGLLAVKADDISGFHANTHIPIVIGAQMRYEITGDTLYKLNDIKFNFSEYTQDVAKFFMQTINSSHSYATGGTTQNEHWTDPRRLATTLIRENEESCTTYNILKVSRNLFRWTKEVSYADYYERAINNGVMGIQRGTDPGVMIYMLPLSPGSSKGVSEHSWGTPFDTFWCCYGTGIESFSKLGDSIYFEEEGKDPGLYIIQYISSSLDWKSGHMMINQKVDTTSSSDPYLRVSISISTKEDTSKASTLHLRIPSWTPATGAKASINSQNLQVVDPGNYLSITRKWSNGDKITLELPVNLRTEAIKDDRPKYASIQAILFGPYLLAGHSDGDWDMKCGLSNSLSDCITPIPQSYNDHLVTFSQESGDSRFVLANLNQSLAMEKFPEYGTNFSVFGTFRLISSDIASASSSFKLEDFIGRPVMLEPFNLPGMILVHQGKEDVIAVSNAENRDNSSHFNLVPGLDGKNGSVSLESAKYKGCYMFSGTNYNAASVRLSCKPNTSDTLFNDGASFVMDKGLSKYHPISFVANGQQQKFLLQPFMSFMDEFYTVYFNITA